MARAGIKVASAVPLELLIVFSYYYFFRHLVLDFDVTDTVEAADGAGDLGGYLLAFFSVLVVELDLQVQLRANQVFLRVNLPSLACYKNWVTFVVSLDVGTSSVRALLFDQNGV